MEKLQNGQMWMWYQVYHNFCYSLFLYRNLLHHGIQNPSTCIICGRTSRSWIWLPASFLLLLSIYFIQFVFRFIPSYVFGCNTAGESTRTAWDLYFLYKNDSSRVCRIRHLSICRWHQDFENNDMTEIVKLYRRT